MVASVNIVPHENVIGIRRWTSTSEEFFKIVKLSMNISTHSHRCGHRLDIGFLK